MAGGDAAPPAGYPAAVQASDAPGRRRGGASSFGGAGLARREPAGESPREPEEGRRDGNRHDDDDDDIDDADFGGDGRDIDFGEGGTEDVRDNHDGAAREDAAAGASGDDATDRVDGKGDGDAGEEWGELTIQGWLED